MLRTLVVKCIALMAYNLADRGLTSLLLTQKPIYSVSVLPKNEFSALTFNPAYSSLCITFTNSFILSLKSFFIITCMSSMYERTITNPFNSLYIFSWNILVMLQNPIGNCFYSYLTHGSTIVQSSLVTGDNYMW